MDKDRYGPFGRKMGGKVVFSGSHYKSKNLTAKYLKKELKVEVPKKELSQIKVG